MRDGRKGRDPRVPRDGVGSGRSGRSSKRPAVADAGMMDEAVPSEQPAAALAHDRAVLPEVIPPGPPIPGGGEPAPNTPLLSVKVALEETRDAEASLEKKTAASPSAAADVWFDLHDKMMGLVRLQRDTSLSMLGVLLTERPLSDKIEAQARTAGYAIEAAAAQWLEISSTAQRLLGGLAPTLDAKRIVDQRNGA